MWRWWQQSGQLVRAARGVARAPAWHLPGAASGEATCSSWAACAAGAWSPAAAGLPDPRTPGHQQAATSSQHQLLHRAGLHTVAGQAGWPPAHASGRYQGGPSSSDSDSDSEGEEELEDGEEMADLLGAADLGAAGGQLGEEDLQPLLAGQEPDPELGPALSSFDQLSRKQQLHQLRRATSFAHNREAQAALRENLAQAGLLGGHRATHLELLPKGPDYELMWVPVDPAAFKMKIVNVNRTAKGTKAGTVLRFSAMAVVGNRDGVLGWGIGKAGDVASATKKAQVRALGSLVHVPRHNGHTIFHRVDTKFASCRLTMYPRSGGSGIIANNLLMTLAKLAGLHDLGVKCHGSRNTRNSVKAFFDALEKQQTVSEVCRNQHKVAHALAVGGRHTHTPNASAIYPPNQDSTNRGWKRL